MRCSSSESRLDAYVDGTLGPRDRTLVADHLRGCASCTELLEEFRVIDALLLTPPLGEPAPNFTFKVMAEVRSLPAPHVHRSTLVGSVVSYLAFAWAAIGLYIAFGGAAARATAASLSANGAHAGQALGTLATSAAHLFGGHTFGVTAAVGAILALDATVAVLALLTYSFVRPRLAARLAPPEAC